MTPQERPVAGDGLPEFRMPACYKHFFTGHRWWCRRCDVVTEDEFRHLAEAWWARDDA